jgi:hypothetical protein
MVDVPYFLNEKPPLCCPDKDTLYASICAGEAFEGFTTAGMHRYQIDSAGDCGLDRLLVLEVKDTAELLSLEVEPSDCDQPNGKIQVAVAGDSCNLVYRAGPFRLSHSLKPYCPVFIRWL